MTKRRESDSNTCGYNYHFTLVPRNLDSTSAQSLFRPSTYLAESVASLKTFSDRARSGPEWAIPYFYTHCTAVTLSMSKRTLLPEVSGCPLSHSHTTISSRQVMCQPSVFQAAQWKGRGREVEATQQALPLVVRERVREIHPLTKQSVRRAFSGVIDWVLIASHSIQNQQSLSAGVRADLSKLILNPMSTNTEHHRDAGQYTLLGGRMYQPIVKVRECGDAYYRKTCAYHPH